MLTIPSESLKDYFTQFGEVTECTVMRDGTTGRSRGFGFLTFKDPKVVNVVMVKEHLLDGKLVSITEEKLGRPIGF
jgi:RNA-binding protein Musashi